VQEASIPSLRSNK